MTSRIYYTDPSRREFDAVVQQVDPLVAETTRYRVRLDRTAFYPTSGGQPHDTGTLGDARVVDVVDDEETGEVLHVLEDPVAEGARVHGVIDWVRRADHMQQHTGQHVLSAAFERAAAARTVSFHLGALSSTVDLEPEVTPAQVTAAERAANDSVWENRPVSIRFVDAREAARLPLRREPARGGTLRVIDIDGVDLSTCGGTHVARTGEIGAIAVLGAERFKGGTRVEFVCGARALAAWRTHRDSVVAATRLVSVLPHELPAGIERLAAENKALERANRRLSQALAGYEADALAARADQMGALRVVLGAVDRDANGLKALAQHVAAQPGHVAVVFSTGRPALVVAARAGDASLDCREVLRVLLARFGGRGGGRPELAQGGGLDAPAGELVEAARAQVATMAGVHPPGA